MRKHSMPEMKEGGVNVTPLIDVVMCLIIFFMLVAKIGVVSGSDKDVAVPEAFKYTDIRDMGNTMTLNVRNGTDGPLVTGLGAGSVIAPLKMKDIINGKQVDPLLATLTQYHDQNPAFKVVIRGDKTLTFSNLAPVLIELTKARVATFAFAANPGNSPGSSPVQPVAQ
jgi:biopolymer transport protein ExbD